ncbi:MAG: BlaI/MecI/CopY family transcriptional regulator [Pirellulaceae bacterium]|nr:BlaI/MecI/CopY family transcriptional regulator [Planctomycetales bacterium]
MARPESSHPTELELDILKILWQESPLPVRDVRARLESDAGRTLAHSSVITMLNIMHRKRYVKRRTVNNAFLFSPNVKKGSVAGQMMEDLLRRAFDGSATAMMLSLIESRDLDATELAELRQMINRKSKEQRR